MPRSGADARRRLLDAALALYAAQGFDATTTAEIAARAGVTERTFFRHFSDKREVLFESEASTVAELSAALATVPASMPPLTTMREALRAMVPYLEQHRDLSIQHDVVIGATPALQERQLAKTTALIATSAAELAARGVPEDRATLAASVGFATFAQARVAWLADPAVDLDDAIVAAFKELRDLVREATT